MPSTDRRVVVSGIGVVTPIGITLDTFWESLRAGRSGIRRAETFDLSALPSQIGGEVRGFDPAAHVARTDRKRLGQMSRGFQFAVGAARMALADARLDRETIDPQRLGVICGSGSQPGELAELGPAALVAAGPDRNHIDLAAWGERGVPLIPPMWLLNFIPNIGAAHVSIFNNAQGPLNTVTQSDAAGILALGEAVRVIQRGRAELMLAGGADTKLFPAHSSRFNLMLALSRRNDDPERACRPFDRDRDGTVLSEGAGFLLLEELDHARARGAKIYAEVTGFASGLDIGKTGRVLGQVAARALAEAGVGRDQLDHINAHGYGCPVDDRWEARGIVASGAAGPVLAVKSYIGNLGAAAGAVELAASLLALDRGTVPATLNYETPDPECPVEVVRAPRPLAGGSVLKLGFTPLGQCGAVVVRKWS